MFFNFKYHVKQKIRELLERAVYDSDKMSWKDELRAAKTIETYVNMLKGDTKI